MMLKRTVLAIALLAGCLLQPVVAVARGPSRITIRGTERPQVLIGVRELRAAYPDLARTFLAKAPKFTWSAPGQRRLTQNDLVLREQLKGVSWLLASRVKRAATRILHHPELVNETQIEPRFLSGLGKAMVRAVTWPVRAYRRMDAEWHDFAYASVIYSD